MVEHNNKTYQKIELYAGVTIEMAVKKLHTYKEDGVLVCVEFNGCMLYSDEVTVESAYLAICGCTKQELLRRQEEERREYERREEEHKARIPELTKKWIEEGHKVLDEKYWSHWDKVVPIRLSDLYHGMELKMCLDIVVKLNSGCLFTEAKGILDGQGHSGMSYGLMKAMLREFCDRGGEFVEYLGKE